GQPSLVNISSSDILSVDKRIDTIDMKSIRCIPGNGTHGICQITRTLADKMNGNRCIQLRNLSVDKRASICRYIPSIQQFIFRREMFNSMRYQFFIDQRVIQNALDRKSTRLNSSHVSISYAV